MNTLTRMLGLAWLALAPGWVLAACPADHSGIRVPAGFCAQVFARDVGDLRHLTVGPDGTVYAALSAKRRGGGIAILKDRNGDGRADVIRYSGDVTGTGIGLHGGYLYFGENERIVRFRLAEDGLPQGPMQVVADGFPRQYQHAAKSIAFDDAGHLYVNLGAPSNACQREDRQPHSPGIDPCPLLVEHGGIWRFSADKTNQRFTAAARYATGLRNVVALAWNRQAAALYGAMNGRDQLHDNWPERFTAEQSAELPAEELLRIEPGANYGWPYCYYDGARKALVLAPEYGGDGTTIGRCARYAKPLVAFPAHWAPLAMTFYDASAFPPAYRGGAFIAFHGSWNRAPLPQQGFVVAFVPFARGVPSSGWQVFADGFAGAGPIRSPGDARFRPVGVAVGPHGALYVADSQRGWIWRIDYGSNGNSGNGDKQLR